MQNSLLLPMPILCLFWTVSRLQSHEIGPEFCPLNWSWTRWRIINCKSVYSPFFLWMSDLIVASIFHYYTHCYGFQLYALNFNKKLALSSCRHAKYYNLKMSIELNWVHSAQSNEPFLFCKNEWKGGGRIRKVFQIMTNHMEI